MGQAKISSKVLLLCINVGIVLGMLIGYRNYSVDRYSLFAVGGVSLVVLNGMFFAIRATEPDLPKEKLRRLNKYYVWPFLLLAALTAAVEYFCGK